MDDLNVISQLIVQLLSNSPPELGARLKQRLNTQLISRGLGPLDEKSYGFKKFADFLLSVLGEKVSIERPDGAGDIHVSLRHPPLNQTSPTTPPCPAEGPSSPVIRSDVWQAFANPDPQRRRYFQIETHAIRHFLRGEPSPLSQEVEQHPAQYIEITPISGQEQIDWMRSFLDSARLSPNERSPLETLIAETYSSSVNATFTRALGQLGNAWRQFRTNNVTGAIQAWSQQHNVPFEHLCAPKNPKTPPQGAVQNDDSLHPPRQQAIKLLELLSEQDISRLVIPTLLSIILVKSRM